MSDGNGNGRKMEWLYRFIVIGALGWLVSRVEGVDVIEATLRAMDARITAVAAENDRRNDGQDRSIQALWQRDRQR